MTRASEARGRTRPRAFPRRASSRGPIPEAPGRRPAPPDLDAPEYPPDDGGAARRPRLRRARVCGRLRASGADASRARSCALAPQSAPRRNSRRRSCAAGRSPRWRHGRRSARRTSRARCHQTPACALSPVVAMQRAQVHADLRHLLANVIPVRLVEDALTQVLVGTEHPADLATGHLPGAAPVDMPLAGQVEDPANTLHRHVPGRGYRPPRHTLLAKLRDALRPNLSRHGQLPSSTGCMATRLREGEGARCGSIESADTDCAKQLLGVVARKARNGRYGQRAMLGKKSFPSAVRSFSWSAA